MTLVDGFEEETEALRKLLCAIHSKKYRIETADELKRLTRLADYYCTLPVVSGTLTGALFRSSMFESSGSRYDAAVDCKCHDDSVSLLLLARKLRHGLLFRECLIHTVGRWDSLPDIEKRQIEEDPKLYTLVQTNLKSCMSFLPRLKAHYFGLFLRENSTFSRLLLDALIRHH